MAENFRPMEIQNRFDIFEPGDLTALVCLDVPEVQRIVVDQLVQLGYKLHTGLFVEDILLKLQTHVYDVVIVSEHFNATDIETNPILQTAINAPTEQRRNQIIILVGASFATNDEMQAFQHSVDLVVGLADVVNLRPVLRRTTLRAQEFFGPLQEALKVAGKV
jgi:CheY-like chemotaxis protein